MNISKATSCSKMFFFFFFSLLILNVREISLIWITCNVKTTWDPRVKPFMKTKLSCHFRVWFCKELYGTALQRKKVVICRLKINSIRKNCLPYSLLSLSRRLFIRNGIWIYLKAKKQHQLEKLNMSEIWTLLLSATISVDNRNEGNKRYMMYHFSLLHLWENACA